MSISSLFWSYDNVFLWGIDQKSGNRKYLSLSFSQYLETGAYKNTKFGTSVSNKTLLSAAKCQGYSFYRFGVIKGNPRGGRG